MDDLNEERIAGVRTRICHIGGRATLADYDEEVCAKPEEGVRNIFVVGNSFAADTYMMLARTFPEAVFKQATAGGCPAIVELIEAGPAKCRAINAMRFELLKKYDYDAVVWGHQWPTEASRVENQVRATFDVLKELDGEVFVFGERMRLSASSFAFFEEAETLREAEETAAKSYIHSKATNAEVKRLTAAYGFNFVEMLDVQCPGVCPLAENGVPLYMDEFHLSPHGADVYGAILRKRLEPIVATD